ncbi:MAG: hypothetical protein ACYDC6_12715 [Acidobacteriaceae bacterium]
MPWPQPGRPARPPRLTLSGSEDRAIARTQGNLGAQGEFFGRIRRQQNQGASGNVRPAIFIGSSYRAGRDPYWRIEAQRPDTA